MRIPFDTGPYVFLAIPDTEAINAVRNSLPCASTKAFPELEHCARTPETEALLQQFAITADDAHSRCQAHPSHKEKPSELLTGLHIHDADLETRWW